MSRTADYLQTVTSLQHVIQDLEVNLDRTRAETDNEWRIRYDIHLRYKRCLEMRTYRLIERVKLLREALRDGGLEFHRDYVLKTEHALRRMLYEREIALKEKLTEFNRKEQLLEREAKILKQERSRRRLLEQELDALKLNTTNLLWTEKPDFLEIPPAISARRLLKQRLDDVVDTVLSGTEGKERRRPSEADPFEGLPRGLDDN